MDDERRMDEERVQKVKEAHARIAETLIQSAAEPRLRAATTGQAGNGLHAADAAETDSNKR